MKRKAKKLLPLLLMAAAAIPADARMLEQTLTVETRNGEICPDDHHPHIIDLGLPSGTRWACCNVGATLPEGYGDYFAWGETSTKSSYTEENSTTYGVSNSSLKSRGIIDSNGDLTAKYDAATANWGSGWHMPTETQIGELVDNCTWSRATQNGINGYKVTGTNGNSIFLPSAGGRDGSSLNDAGSYGYYRSSTAHSLVPDYAYNIGFNNDGNYWGGNGTRYVGISVRPVAEHQQNGGTTVVKEEVNRSHFSIASADHVGSVDEEAIDNAIVEVQAQYPGGEAALVKAVNENLVYPSIAQEQDLQGVVTLRFRVEKDGAIGIIVIEKGLSKECDQAAINVVKKLRRFKPARLQGRPVPVWFTLPVRFKLQ